MLNDPELLMVLARERQRELQEAMRQCRSINRRLRQLVERRPVEPAMRAFRAGGRWASTVWRAARLPKAPTRARPAG